MSFKSNLKTLDQLVVKGQFIEAVNQFFADSVVSYSKQEPAVAGKTKKIEGLNHFLAMMESVNEITLHDSATKDAESFSLFTFKFTQKGGHQLTWNEVIRRVWKDGLVVEEEYLLSDSAQGAKAIFASKVPTANKVDKKNSNGLAKPAPVAKSATTTPATAKKTEAQPVEEKQPVTKKTVATKKTGTKKTNEVDDLKKIEGIGPKIANLLMDAGIATFEALSKATPESIKATLLAAGSRYRMHDPLTWPKQAQMAAKGKWEELKKWQDELKGGKAAN